MSMLSQTILNEEIRQQQLLLYFNSVWLDFDNIEEIDKLKTKLKKAELLLTKRLKQK
ncbi:MAG: hypothetical protein V4651_14605 [Bacteroidota bacterium]